MQGSTSYVWCKYLKCVFCCCCWVLSLFILYFPLRKPAVWEKYRERERQLSHSESNQFNEIQLHFKFSLCPHWSVALSSIGESKVASDLHNAKWPISNRPTTTTPSPNAHRANHISVENSRQILDEMRWLGRIYAMWDVNIISRVDYVECIGRYLFDCPTLPTPIVLCVPICS